jgi:DNA-binding winged helix-turn-helix (wHTH) protein
MISRATLRRRRRELPDAPARSALVLMNPVVNGRGYPSAGRSPAQAAPITLNVGDCHAILAHRSLSSGSRAVESSLYEFGSFTVQPDERLLLREGRPVSLTPKAFDLLIQLIERPGQLVGKQELMTALWPETFVEEANLAYTMSALRRALGDGQDGNQYIQTVPTRGYRFVSPVMRKEPAVSITADRIPPDVTSRRRRFPAIAVAAVAIAGLGGLFIASWAPWRDAPSTASMQLSIELGVQAALPTTDAPFALSADGTLLAFVAHEKDAETRLYVRRLDQVTATAIPGTERAEQPFFSPGAQWVAFFADLKLKTVPVTGGAVRTLADVANPRGGKTTRSSSREAGLA